MRGGYGKRADETASAASARVTEVPVLKLEYLKFQYLLFYSSLEAIIARLVPRPGKAYRTRRMFGSSPSRTTVTSNCKGQNSP